MRSIRSHSGRFALLAFLVTLVACEAKQQDVSLELPVVGVAEVVTRKVDDWEEFSGRLEAPEVVELRPRVSGPVVDVLFRDGATVRKGEVLFRIDPRPFEVEVQRLEARLRQAVAIRTRTESEARRGDRLKARSAMSTELAEARRAAAEEAGAEVAAIQAQVEAARLNLGYTRITAPIDGRLSTANVTVGNLVSADSTLLTTLLGTRNLHAYFDMDEGTYLRLSSELLNAGEPALVHVELTGRAGEAHRGHLDFIDNQVSPLTGTLRARAVLDNAAGTLIPGLYVRLKLQGLASYEAAMIRDEAIGVDLGKRYVLVLGGDGVLSYREVELGPKQEGLRIVRSGLKGGDVVVVSGLQRARPGAKVSPRTMMMVIDDVPTSAEIREPSDSTRTVAQGVAQDERTDNVTLMSASEN